MNRRFANSALAYAAVAMVCGVFYREYTKFSGFAGQTRLSVLHTHYFLLGMVFFLLLLLLEKSFTFSRRPQTARLVVGYHIGLNITGAGLLIRGLTQVWGTQLSTGMDAAISGISGLGHICLGICMLLLLIQLRRKTA